MAFTSLDDVITAYSGQSSYDAVTNGRLILVGNYEGSSISGGLIIPTRILEGAYEGFSLYSGLLTATRLGTYQKGFLNTQIPLAFFVRQQIPFFLVVEPKGYFNKLPTPYVTNPNVTAFFVKEVKHGN